MRITQRAAVQGYILTFAGMWGAASAASFPQSAVLVLPKSDAPTGDNLTFSLVDHGIADTDMLFHATKIWITHENGTEMTSSRSPFGTATLGNASTRPWDSATGEFAALPPETVCRKPKSSNKPSVAKFVTTSWDWPAGEYTIHIEEIVHHGSGGVSKSKDGTFCISPPYTTETKITFVDTKSKAPLSSVTTSVGFPKPTGANAATSQLDRMPCRTAATVLVALCATWAVGSMI